MIFDAQKCITVFSCIYKGMSKRKVVAISLEEANSPATDNKRNTVATNEGC